MRTRPRSLLPAGAGGVHVVSPDGKEDRHVIPDSLLRGRFNGRGELISIVPNSQDGSRALVTYDIMGRRILLCQ